MEIRPSSVVVRVLALGAGIITQGLVVLALTGSAASQESDGWLAQARRAVEAKEYEVSLRPRGLQAPNRAQNLRTWFAKDGIAIHPRVHAGEEPPWTLVH